MWMPLRSAKMYGFIFGFQRRVWWPKWTPASSSWRIETDGMGRGPPVRLVLRVPRVPRTGGLMASVRPAPRGEQRRVCDARRKAALGARMLEPDGV